MKTFFKWFFISFTAFIVLLFGIAGLLDDKYSVQRSVKIAAPQDSVFFTVADLNTWKNWNPWLLVDSNMTVKINVTDSLEGSYWEWSSNQIGKGKLTFRKVAVPDSIYAVMEFISPKTSIVDEFWYFRTENDSTVVTWKHVGALDYPIGRILGIWSDNMLGPTFEEGLNLLKDFTEKKFR